MQVYSVQGKLDEMRCLRVGRTVNSTYLKIRQTELFKLKKLSTSGNKLCLKIFFVGCSANCSLWRLRTGKYSTGQDTET